MKSGKNRLFQLSLGILTTVFFGCGNDGNLGNEMASGLNNIEQVSDNSASENVNFLRNILSQIQIDNSNFKEEVVNLAKELQKKDSELKKKNEEYKTMAEKMLRSNGEEKKSLQNRLFNLECEIEQKKADSNEKTRELIEQNEKLQEQILELEESVKTTRNAFNDFIDSKCNCNELFECLDKFLSELNNKKENLTKPKCILEIGKKAFVISTPDTFTAYELGVDAVFKSFVKLIEKDVVNFKNRLEEKKEDPNIRESRVVDYINKLEEFIEWKDIQAESDRLLALENCYKQFDLDTCKQTGINYNCKMIVDSFDQEDFEVKDKDRNIVRSFCTAYGLRDLKTDRREFAIVYSALNGKSLKYIMKKAPGAYNIINDAHVSAIKKSLELINSKCGNISEVGKLISSIAIKNYKDLKDRFKNVKFISSGNLYKLANEVSKSDFEKIRNVIDFKDIDKPMINLDNLDKDNKAEWCSWFYNNVPTYMELGMVCGAKFDKKNMKNVYSKNEEARKFVNQKVEVDADLG